MGGEKQADDLRRTPGTKRDKDATAVKENGMLLDQRTQEVPISDRVGV